MKNKHDDILIEKIVQFDKAELPAHKLIFLKYRLNWLVKLSFAFLAIGGLIYIALVQDSWLTKAICLLLVPLALWIAMSYSRGKTHLILRMYCIKYKINSDDIWKNRFFVLKEVQLKKLIILLSQFRPLSDKKIMLIIESLRSENTSVKYKYQVL